MPLLEKTLERLKREGALVELRRDALSDDPIIGFIAHLTDELIALSRVSPGGQADGVSVVFLGDVTRVRWDGADLEGLAALARAKEFAMSIPMMDLASPQRAIESLAQSCGHVALMSERPDATWRFAGELDDIDEDCVVITEFAGFEGAHRASLLLRADEVTRIDAGAARENDLDYLNRRATESG